MPADTVKHTPLLPCPMCGGKAEIWRAHPENPKRGAWIACVDRCLVLTKEYDADEKAIAAWNRRSPDPVREKLVEALEPFATAADTEDEVGREYPDDDRIWLVQAYGCQLADLTVSDLHRAREAFLLAKGEKA